MSEILILAAKSFHSEMLWKLRNDPIVRQMSKNTEKISWEEHSSWYEKFLLDNCRKIYIGEKGDIFIGAVRFEKCDNEEYVYKVSLLISRESRGKGFGKKLLSNGIRKLLTDVENCKLIRAEVKSNNKSSNKIFKSSGFSFIESDSEMNTLELAL